MNSDIKVLKKKVNISKLRDWFEELEKSYSHLKWSAEDKNVDEGVGGHMLNGVYGWALQSNLEDLDKPCPPYNITKEAKQEYRDTAAMFGYINEIREHFPFAHQFSIAVHPPGTQINLHHDSDDFYKIHVPIFSNNRSLFIFEPKREYILPDEGKMYLVNTSVKHGTKNNGDTNRVHLFFKIPHDKELDVLNMSDGEI